MPPVGRQSTDATFEALTQGKTISLTQTGLLMEAATVSGLDAGARIHAV